MRCKILVYNYILDLEWVLFLQGCISVFGLIFVGGFVYIIVNYEVVFKSSSICDVVGGALDSQLQEASRGVMF